MINLGYLLEIATDVVEGTENTEPTVDPVDPVDPVETTEPIEEGTEPSEEPTETLYEIDGEKYTPEQIKEWKQGHLRQSDYTKKTQEIANARKEHAEALELYEYFKANPHLAEELSKLDGTKKDIVNSIQNKDVQDLQIKMKAIEIDKELEILKMKDKDFDEVEVLNLATKEGMSIDKAYKLWRGENLDKILEKKMAEKSAQITDNIKKNNVISKTLITSKDKTVSNFGLSEQELAMASKLDMTPEEYAKWR